MATRKHDVSFSASEKLWRRIELDEVVKKDNKVKPSSLRLQVSVVRERYGNKDGVCDARRNGIAEIGAKDAADISCGAVKLICVDDPSQADDGHALIAFVSHPGDEVSPNELEATRKMLATKLNIVLAPKKPEPVAQEGGGTPDT